MTIGGTFWQLAVVGGIRADVEEVGGACYSASISQFMLSEQVFIAADGKEASSRFTIFSDVFGFIGETPSFFYFLFLPPFLDFGVAVTVTVSIEMFFITYSDSRSVFV